MHITKSDLEAAAATVHAVMPATPQHHWPLLSARVGAEIWVKHENHTPLGAFKVRGGIVYLDALKRREPGVTGVISATRGNHGQSVAFSARRHGLTAMIVVPHGNSVEKNAAMRALGAELVEIGRDFDEALVWTRTTAVERKLHLVPPFARELVLGVATYAHELFTSAAAPDVVYVPIGLGSGICGLIKTRDALGLKTEIVGVVSTNAQTYALSVAAGRPVPTNSADTMADGLAVRVPHEEALAIIKAGAARIVSVSDAEVEAAIRAMFTDTHNLAEGAGAAPLAAALKERGRLAGRRVALIQSGGNIDRVVYQRVLAQG